MFSGELSSLRRALCLLALLVLSAVFLGTEAGTSADLSGSATPATNAGASSAAGRGVRAATDESPLELVRSALRSGVDNMPRAKGKRSKGSTRPSGSRGSVGRSSGQRGPGTRGTHRPTGARIARNSRLDWEGWPNNVIAPVGLLATRYANGSPGECTGTVLTKTLVITAAHCVYDHGTSTRPAAGGAQSVAFIPGMTWANLDVNPATFKMPYGIWETGSANWWVPQGWIDNGDLGLDFALVEFGPQPGWLGAKTGTYAAHWNLKYRSARLYVVGYPSDGQFATKEYAFGLGQYACDSSFGGDQEQIGSGWLVLTACSMNRGSSGGPWFIQLANGQWVITAVTSQCGGGQRTQTTYCVPKSDWSKGMYLDGNFEDFWNSVQALLHW